MNHVPGGTSAAAPPRAPLLLLVAGVLLVAANLRPVITAVGPVLDQIGAETGLGAAALGLLASVPLLAFAAVSPLTHGLSERFGVERTVFGALLVLAAGTLLRSVPGPLASLWIGSFVIGGSIAVCNVLLPAIIKRDFPDRMAQLTAAYSAVLGGIASLGAGLSVPLSALPLGTDGAPAGWRFALAAFVVLGIPAIIAWVPRLRAARDGRGGAGRGPAPAAGAPGRGRGPDPRAGERAARPMARGEIWRSTVAWQVTLYMGLQSMVFYIFISWLPTLERSYGRSDAGSGWDLMAFQIIGVAASLLTPLMMRGRLRRIAPSLPGAVVIAAMAGLLAAPGAMFLWVLLAGFGCGSSLVVALSLFGLRARTHREASALSGMAQSLGYLFAAAGPPLFGALYARTGEWVLPVGVVVAACIGQVLTGLLVGRERYVSA
ncbi:MAG: MFS transporter [Arthrobacter sp.]|uniref:MFS transporter n=1 Tax=Arthrobacter sp. TaxID=1667 RepID=UPI003490335C